MPYKDREIRKQASKKFHKEWYEKNKIKRRQQIKNRKVELREWLSEYKSHLKCSECGENHPACLDFHHTDASSKDFSISNISAKGWGKSKVLEEIKKCIILCSNCHRKLHYALDK